MSTTALAGWGGKGANLVRLREAGLPVPEFVIVPTEEYARFVAAADLAPTIADGLAESDPDVASTTIRGAFAAAALTPDQRERLTALIAPLTDPGDVGGSRPALAVRSSATAEDLPGLSFAGQQDTFLDVEGTDRVLDAIIACWSSIWTARAISYRHRNDIDHAAVSVAVVVQRMVPAEVSGVLFTANPRTGRRAETVIDAAPGLGEALVSGRVVPDNYVLDSVTARVRTRDLASQRPLLSDGELRELVGLGDRIQALQGTPQDIEWAIAGELAWVLQARAVTTLYPIPEPADPSDIWLSFGGFQGMLAPITPLGQDCLRALGAGATRLGGLRLDWRGLTFLASAGERLWVRVTPLVTGRLGAAVRPTLPLVDPGVAAILARLLSEPGWGVRGTLPRGRTIGRLARFLASVLPRLPLAIVDPAGTRARVERTGDALVHTLGTVLDEIAGADDPSVRLAGRAAALEEAAGLMLATLLPVFAPVMLTSLVSLRRLNALAVETGLPDAAGLPLTILGALPGNVTTEMDLRLADLAGDLHDDPQTVDLLATLDAADLVERYRLGTLPPRAQEGLTAYLDRYGSRGVAEIDIGARRWGEDPEPVFHHLATAATTGQPDARTNHRATQRAATEAVDRLAAAAPALQRAQVRLLARAVRGLFGARETPKFTIVRCLGLLRHALLASGRDLVAAGRLEAPEDICFLHLDELRDAFDRDWRSTVRTRRETWAAESRRTRIPRVLVGDGRAFHEGLGGDGDLVGLGVSPGVAEGRVRVVFDPRAAHLEPGDILVCPGTDPAWTPLFLTAGGLITEVGGLMTHGSVLARECGIPAVVGIDAATTRLTDGQRVRLDGASGAIELLPDESDPHA